MREHISNSKHETEFLLERLNRTAEEADRLAAHMAAQYSIAAVLSRSMSLGEVQQAFTTELHNLVPFDSMKINIMSEDEVEAQSRSDPAAGETTLLQGPEIGRDDDGPAGWVLNHGQSLHCADLEGDDRFPAHKSLRLEGLRSYAVLPLMIRGNPSGTLFLGSRRPHSYEGEMAFLEFIAVELALGIEKTRLYEEIQRQAITDPLTKLYNRRQFEKRLTEEIQRARRYGHALAVVMGDLDHFKHYNDTLGHPQGDQLLKEVASILRSSVRSTDLVARYGGEEFVILLPQTSRTGALSMAEKIRASVENHDLPFRQDQPEGKVTISLGVAAFPEDLDDPAELVNRADQALYRAKKKGRNRVVGAHQRGLTPPDERSV